MSDKRLFTRVALNVPGTLSHSGRHVDIIVSDVSLHGIKLRAEEALLGTLPFDSHEPYTVTFQANDDSPLITLHIEQLYRHTDSRAERVSLGCKVDKMDIESVSALRRLITLNSADTGIEEKELNALIDAVYSNASSASES